MRYLIAAILLLFCDSALAQSSAVGCAGGQKLAITEAQALLLKVEQRYTDISSFKAAFRQRSYLAALELAEFSSGRVWFEKPGRMKWEYLEPDPQIFLVDNQEFYLYQPEDNQVVIDYLEQILLSDVPVTFLLGLGDLNSKYEVVEACKILEGTVLALKPQRQAPRGEGQTELAVFRLLVHSTSFDPLGAEVMDSSGNLTAIWFGSRELNPAISDEIFALKLPRGVDRLDRRKKSERRSEP